MKKACIYIVTLLLVSFITISGTYAFFTATITNDDAIETGTHQLLVKYSGDVAIEGKLELSRTKEEGFRRELNIGLYPNSLEATANFFLYVDEITEGLRHKALRWEIYEVINNEEKYIRSGNFLDITPNSKTYIAENLTLSTTTTRTFAVYLWINGDEAGNEVVDTKLIGYFGAETATVSGITSGK